MEPDSWGGSRSGRLSVIDRVPRAARGQSPAFARTDEAVAERFSQLAAQWRDQTAHLSSVTQRVAHPSYQQIIGLGPQAVPCLIESLRQATDHWFPALVAIVGADHASGARTPSDAATRWVAWYDAASPADE